MNANATLPAGTDVTNIDLPVSELPTVYRTYTVKDFLIGLAICLAASLANAGGVNLTKLDHVRQEKIPIAKRTRDWLRPLWLAGLTLYIASQLVGSTLALEYMRAEYVAPLGSTSLIFNFIFAKLLVGTSITKWDYAGTGVVILGVVGVVAFGNLRISTDSDPESNLNLETLKHLWGRGGWLVYFICLEIASITAFWIASIINQVWTEKQELETSEDPSERLGRKTGGLRGEETFWQSLNRRRHLVRLTIKSRIADFFVSKPDVALRKLSGLAWAISGGLLAGQSLVYAKSAVKLVSADASGDATQNQLASPLSIFIILLLIVVSVVQIYCLNKGLKVYESTLVVPLFFATYTASGFLNSLIYLDQYDNFKKWVFAMTWLSILVLILGVAILAAKKAEAPPTKLQFDNEDEENGGPIKDVEEFQLPDLPKHKKHQQQPHRRASTSSQGEGENDIKIHGYESVWRPRDSTDSEGSSDERPRRPKYEEQDEEFGSFIGESKTSQ